MEVNGTELEATRCQISDDQINFYDRYAWWLKGIASVSIAVLGIVLNLIAVYILCHKEMRESFFHRLLICLTVVDSLFLANGIYVSFVLRLIEPSSRSLQYIFVSALYPARNILMCSSIYMTVGLSYERYTSIVRPYLQLVRRKKNSLRRLFSYVTPVILFSILFNAPKFFELKLVDRIVECHDTTKNQAKKTECIPILEISPTDLRNDKAYILWYLNVANLMVTSIIPGLLLSFFNYRIYSASRERHQKRAKVFSRGDQQSGNDTKVDGEIKQRFVLFAIVVMFFICHLLRIALNVAELVDTEMKQEQWNKGCPGIRFWGMIAVPISGVMLQINSCADFFIYCIYDKLFKDTLSSYIPSRLRSNDHLTASSSVEEKIEMKNAI